MFEVEESSIELNANPLNGLETIVEEYGSESHRRELSAHEKKELDRKKRAGKVGGKFFKKEDMSNDNDVIATGSGFSAIQEKEKQTVEVLNLSESDRQILIEKYLMKRFDQPNTLSANVQTTVKKRFQEGPTVIQQYVVPLILNTKNDIIARAKTGSGKSAAFILPIIELIQREKMRESEEVHKRINSSAPYALIFEPTRELCIQLAKEVRRLAEGTSVKCAFSFGRMDAASTYNIPKMGADIVVGTPSRLNHLFFGIEGNEIHKKCFDFTNLKYIVMDEADRLVEQVEFCTNVLAFKEQVDASARFFMFGATDGTCESARQMFTNEPIEVIVGGDEAPVRNIVQMFVEYDPTNTNIVRYKGREIDCPLTKLDYLVFLMDRYKTHTDEKGYKRVPKTIVFVQNKRSSDSVAIWLLRNGFRATALNGDHDTGTRIQVVRGIQENYYDIVVATDVLARGINIQNVHTVFNYELPVQCPVNYIHRIGRTARMGNVGRVISFYDTTKNGNLAPYLEKWLKDCGQEPPEFLSKVSCDITEKVLRRLTANQNEQTISGIPMQRTVLDPGVVF